MIRLKTLQQRLSFYIMLPVTLLLILMDVVGFMYSREKLISEWQVSVILHLQLAAHRMDMLLLPIKAQILSMNNDDGVTFISRDVFEWNMNRLKQQNGVVQVILNYNNVPASPGSSPFIYHPDTNPVAKNSDPKKTVGNLYSIDFLKYNRIQKITSPRFGNFVEDQTISLISSLLDGSGNPIGRIEVVVSYEYLIHAIKKSGWWRNSKAFLVDDTGKILVSAISADREMLGETNESIEIETLKAMKKSISGTLMGDEIPPEEVSGFYKLEQAPWTIVLIAPGKQILSSVNRFQYIYIGIAAVFIFFILILIRLVAGRAVSSIREVSRAANNVALGEYESFLTVSSEDEIGELASSFNTMVSQLRERMRLKEALNLAMEVQQSLLPFETLKLEGLGIAGKSLYCEETGGDYFDFLTPDETYGSGVGVVIGDVSATASLLRS